jgi:TonB family protein
MNALMYQSNCNRRFAAALTAAAIIHVAAIGFATTRQEAPPIASGPTGEPPVIDFIPPDPIVDPQPDQSDPLPTPPTIDEFYLDNTATPPPVHREPTKFTPLVKRSTNSAPSSLNLSAAKVLALNAPRPEYPYEARRQKITGDGVVVMNVDPASGNVTGVSMAKSTGNTFLDNAAIAGFRRWRFKPGSVSTVTCPVTFTLNGANY